MQSLMWFLFKIMWMWIQMNRYWIIWQEKDSSTYYTFQLKWNTVYTLHSWMNISLSILFSSHVQTFRLAFYLHTWLTTNSFIINSIWRLPSQLKTHWQIYAIVRFYDSNVMAQFLCTTFWMQWHRKIPGKIKNKENKCS